MKVSISKYILESIISMSLYDFEVEIENSEKIKDHILYRHWIRNLKILFTYLKFEGTTTEFMCGEFINELDHYYLNYIQAIDNKFDPSLYLQTRKPEDRVILFRNYFFGLLKLRIAIEKSIDDTCVDIFSNKDALRNMFDCFHSTVAPLKEDLDKLLLYMIDPLQREEEYGFLNMNYKFFDPKLEINIDKYPF